MDEVFVDYSLGEERSILLALMEHAAINAIRAGFRKPVHAIAVGFWVEGGRLRIVFVSNADGNCSVDDLFRDFFRDGYFESREGTTFQGYYAIPSWCLLNTLAPPIHIRVREKDPPPGMSIEEWDEYALGRRELVDAVGRYLTRLIAENYTKCFDELEIADPCSIVVYEDEDSDRAWVISLSAGNVTIQALGSATPLS